MIIKPVVSLHSLNLHTVPITIPLDGSACRSQIKPFILSTDWCDDSWRQHQSLLMRGRLFDPASLRHRRRGSSVEVRPTTNG